ncbi:hypothetical protein TorRG33x02_225090 [Trema orientale]|uniref:Uncharacterized protein n=1 Tax=Trema orientale TaxID=63057 RepID=A0A2P5E864_TREOI|nr:hypothetical protein TorRG33x02_225090 [Trema orientale]
MRTLETQLGQLSNAITNRPQRVLLSNTKVNPRNEGEEHCIAITLRSGKEILKPVEKPTSKPSVEEVIEEEQIKENDGEKPIEEVNVDSPSTSLSKPYPYNPPLPFPQRFQKKKLD